MSDNRKPWHRRPKETAVAHAAFQLYLEHGSIDAAWRATEQGQTSNAKRAPGQWAKWSSKHEWVERAASYADHLAEQNRQLWEQRRRELQERDWAQADRLRQVVDEAIPHANLFIRRHVSTVNGETVITLAYDITALTTVLEKASKLQRLATDEPTENINNLSGAALDAYAASLLARIVNGGETHGDAAPDGDGAGGGDQTGGVV